MLSTIAGLSNNYNTSSNIFPYFLTPKPIHLVLYTIFNDNKSRAK